MLKAILAAAISAVLALAADRPANAVTIDEFLFDYGLSELAIQLTGAVEPDGFIQLADLTGFELQSAVFTPILPKADVSFFSFDTTGGASSLDFIVSDPAVPILVCGGAAVGLVASCNPSGEAPPDATATVILGGALHYSTDFPVVTLLSSTTTPTWMMLLLGFAGLALARSALAGRRGERRRPAPV